ncbi:MAG: S41 family peptidase [Phycisphaerales bacterium JB041]
MHPRLHALSAVILASLSWIVLPACGAVQDGNAAEEGPAGLEFGFERGAPGDAVPPWFVPTPGWAAVLTDAAAASGEKSLLLEQRADSDAPFGNVMRGFDATAYRGKRVRLSARVIAEGGPSALAMMWLRADLDDRTTGAFDNMSDRPIRAGAAGSREWSDAVIEIDIEPNAESLAVGFMAQGGATVFIDDVRLSIVGDAAERTPPQAASAAVPLSARGLENVGAAARLLALVRFFHASDQAVAVSAWDHLAVRLMEQAEPAADPADLAARLQAFFAPVAPTVRVWAGGAEDAPEIPERPAGADHVRFWLHYGVGAVSLRAQPGTYSSDVDRRSLPTLGASGGDAPEEGSAAARVVKSLGGGVWCLLPVEVYADKAGTLPHAPAETEWSSLDDKPELTAANRSTRLAGVALIWGVMEHFYPYFDVVGTDWDAALTVALAAAAEAPERVDYHQALQEFVAKLHDGHGFVHDRLDRSRLMLPVAVTWVGEQLVVVGADESVADRIAPGDTVLTIEGRAVDAWYREAAARISASTEGWRRSVSLASLVMEIPGTGPVAIRLRHPDGSESEADVARITPREIARVSEHRAANGSELAPGIVYFDLNGAEGEALADAMPRLSSARGIVFDLRGYPGQAGFQLMPHLSREFVQSARWRVPIITRPDREDWRWNESGRWRLPPVEPYLDAKIAFLTDGRAISYAESIMGIVEAYRMGEIVGATTAGTHGTVNPVEVPGGFVVSWTGMQVLKHDGSRHHGVGIAPTVAASPTVEGIAAGRDEVLERAVAVLQAAIAENAER